MEQTCPICKHRVQSQFADQGLVESGINALSKYGYKSTAKAAGQFVGGALGAFFGPFASSVAAGALGGMFSSMAGSFYDENINTRNDKPLVFKCPCCNNIWTEEDNNVEVIIRRYYANRYENERQIEPTCPVKKDFGDVYEDNKRDALAPISIFAFYIGIFILTWLLYLCTFTYVDLTFSFGRYLPLVILGSILYVIGRYAYLYNKAQERYKIDLDYYNETLPKVKEFNENLERQLLREMEEKINENSTKLQIEYTSEDKQLSFAYNIQGTSHFVENVPSDHEDFHEKIVEWNGLILGAVSETSAVAFGDQGIWYKNVPTELADYFGTISDVVDFNITNNGGYVLIHQVNAYTTAGGPQDFVDALKNANNNKENILSACFNDNGNWAVVTDNNINYDSETAEFVSKALQYGKVYSIFLSDNGKIACCSSGLFYENIPSSLESYIKDAMKDGIPQKIKFTDNGLYLVFMENGLDNCLV